MDLDDHLFGYFGSRHLADIPQTALTAGLERMQVDLGMTRDPGQRFSRWCLLHMLGAAPDLDVAFEAEADREAARNFMDLLFPQS